MTESTQQSTATRPFVVDLDGTLLQSDLLVETGFAFIRNYPVKFYEPILWMGKGKANLKEKLANNVDIDVTVLPYNEKVLELIRDKKQQGCKIILATASHVSLAEKIAQYLGVFDEVFATKAHQNLSSTQKKNLLVELYGESGYDYIGNSMDDVTVWESAYESYIVNPDMGVEKNVDQQEIQAVRIIKNRPPQLLEWAKALRLHQWMKNTLIFVPLLAGHQLFNGTLLLNGVIAFLLFGLCASSVYILNDLLDLNDDRHHTSKKHRAFAAGNISILHGVLAFPVLLAISILGSIFFLPIEFLLVLTVYYCLTIAYSFALKRLMAVDVIALAMLYTIRIIAGAAAFGMALTSWVLAFSMFIFLSLALVKRYAELREARFQGVVGKTRGRGYYPSDLEMVSSLGAASGYLSVMVLALYIQDTSTLILYSNPKIIWLACPLLLFWITRVWMLTHRGDMHDDPIVFAIRDKVSLIVGVLFGLVFSIAL